MTSTTAPFMPETTRQANLMKSERWLEMAITAEGRGSAGVAEKAFGRALQYENAAFERHK